MNRISVLLVEDDEFTRTRIAGIISDNPAFELLATAGNCREARSQLELIHPDVMIVDLGLPDGSGIDLIQELSDCASKTETMVLTVFGDEQHVLSAIRAGATGYLLKDGNPDYLAESIMQLVKGGSPISPAIARHVLKAYTVQPEVDTASAPVVSNLTKRETEVLDYIARGYTFGEIADYLALSPHTVTSHVKHIYKKLAVRSRSEAVYEAVQMGLVSIKC